MIQALLPTLIGAASEQSSGFMNMINQHFLLNRQIRHQEDAQRLQNEANMALTQEYNKAQRELAQSQNEYNTQMWEKQNAYNSPEATMQRLTKAGINPRAYQQIGQFANAGAPVPAVTPEQKMAEYTEPKLSSTQLRMQRLAINNAYTEQKIRAVELGSQLFESYKKREEQKRHNEALETISSTNAKERLEETKRHNQVTEQLGLYKHEREYTRLEADLLKNYGIRVFKPQGIGDGPDNSPEAKAIIGVDIPQYMYDLHEREKLAIVEHLENIVKQDEKAYNKLIKETNYLELKSDLMKVETSNKVLSTLVKLLISVK